MKIASVGAFVAGLLANVMPAVATDAALHATGVFPPAGEPMANGLWTLATAYRALYGVVGAYLTARLAPTKPALHARVLGAVGIAVGVSAALATQGKGPGFGPAWYAWAIALLPVPVTWIGLRLHGRSSRPK